MGEKKECTFKLHEEKNKRGINRGYPDSTIEIIKSLDLTEYSRSTLPLGFLIRPLRENQCLVGGISMTFKMSFTSRASAQCISHLRIPLIRSIALSSYIGPSLYYLFFFPIQSPTFFNCLPMYLPTYPPT